MKTMESKVLTADDKKVNKEFQKEISFIRDCAKSIGKLTGQIGQALINIRDKELWKIGYKTFAEAIETETGLSKGEGYKCIEDAETLLKLQESPIGDSLVKQLDLKTSQIRALSASTDDVEQQVKVLQHIADKKIEPTAKSIKTVADEILPPKVEPEPAEPPKRDKSTVFDPVALEQLVTPVAVATLQPAEESLLWKRWLRTVPAIDQLRILESAVERLMEIEEVRFTPGASAQLYWQATGDDLRDEYLVG